MEPEVVPASGYSEHPPPDTSMSPIVLRPPSSPCVSAGPEQGEECGRNSLSNTSLLGGVGGEEGVRRPLPPCFPPQTHGASGLSCWQSPLRLSPGGTASRGEQGALSLRQAGL